MLAKKHQLLNFINEPIESIEKVNLNRVYRLNSFDIKEGPVIYFMQREQRVDDNWGLLFAQELSDANKAPLIVIFCNAFFKKDIKIKQNFMLAGLIEIKAKLEKLNIPFVFLEEENTLIELIDKIKAGAIVCDFSPLKEHQEIVKKISESTKTAIFEVDSHNIVPARFISKKQEFSAAAFRPKIKLNIDMFLTDYPKLHIQKDFPENLNNEIKDYCKPFCCIKNDWLKGSSTEAKKELNTFIKNRLINYEKDRNNPTQKALSNMSPYLHFGQISSQRIALEILKSKATNENKEAYLEELIVRKELADNFCLYANNYKSFESIQAWAKESLQKHSQDIRHYLYNLEDFEQAKTHDVLWNAAEKELTKKGKIHSYMRMYWAKKILEWSNSPEEALKTAIYLNDKYSLDGVDPNGYTGILWSIGGLHDRPWQERRVFGKIRYMSFNGAKKKFNTDIYTKALKTTL